MAGRRFSGAEAVAMLVTTLFAPACLEYDIGDKLEPAPVTDTGTPPVQTTPIDTVPIDTVPIDTGTPPVPDCSTFVPPAMSWVGSVPFVEADDPTDGSGVPFWDPAADQASFTPVTLPDRDIPIDTDRAYIGTFELAELPVDLSLDLESDDGIWLWLNGTYVGHWGGEWQQEGCVNEHANCLLTTSVPAVEVTSLVVQGTNHIAARVSNPVLNAYFDVIPGCVDR